MKKLLIATAIVSALGAAYAPVASAARSSDVAAGALVGGVLGYAMGQSGNTYSQPAYGYGYAPSYGYGYAPAYGYAPGYSSYYGYQGTYGVSCSGVPGSRPVVDQWGRNIGVQCPNGHIQYYR